MKVEIRQVVEKGILDVATLEKVRVEGGEYILGIDASTTCTGVVIYSRDLRKPVWSLAVKREETESKVRYKLKLKQLLEYILQNNPSIKYSEYEEPFVEYVESASDLLALAPMVDEIIIENEPALDYLRHELVPNKRWKKAFLGNKLPSGSALEKRAITEEVYRLYPYLCATNGKGTRLHFLTQDERDAVGICVAKDLELRGEVTELKSVKVKPFKYEIDFVGGDSFDDAIEYMNKLKAIPAVVRANGFIMAELKRGDKFDTKIMQSIQNDDIIAIIAFNTEVAGNLYVKYKLADYKQYETVYAIVWRKNRKKAQK